jgi:hypothetical protein
VLAYLIVGFVAVLIGIALVRIAHGRKSLPPISTGGSTPASPAITLGSLSFDNATFPVGSAVSGNILGATTGSVITAAGLPTGLTINSAARTWAWDGSGTAGSGSFTLTETLGSASNSPNPSSVGYTIYAGLSAPTFTVWNGSAFVTSASGIADPPTFGFSIGADEGEGDYVEFEIDTVNTFNSANYRPQERVLLWDGTNFEFADPSTFVPTNFTIQTGLTGGTTYFARRWIRRKYGDTNVDSAFSTVISFSTASSGVTTNWNPSDHSTWAGTETLTNANLTWNAQQADDWEAVRSAASFGPGSKFFARFILTTQVTAGECMVGIATGTYGGGTLGSFASSSTNRDQTLHISGSAVFQGTTTNLGQWVAPGSDPVQGDAVGMAVNLNALSGAPNGKIWFSKNDVYQAGDDPVAGTGGFAVPYTVAVYLLGVIKPTVNGHVDALTLDTKASATTHAPTGYTPVGG